jgi:hypothetical protein
MQDPCKPSGTKMVSSTFDSAALDILPIIEATESSAESLRLDMEWQVSMQLAERSMQGQLG